MKFLISVTFVLLTFSCQIEPEEVLRPSPESTPVSVRGEENGLANAPEQSGMFVTRGDQLFAFVIVDRKAGLTATFGINNQEACANFPPPNFEAFQKILTQTITNPNDPSRKIGIQKGEVRVEVYEGIFGIGTENFCDFRPTAVLVGTGTAKINLTDNDLEAYLREEPRNQNAYGVNAKGELYDTDGNALAFKANYRATWDGIDFSSTKDQGKISLK